MKKTTLLIVFVAISSLAYSQGEPETDSQQLGKRLNALEEKVEKMGQLTFSGYVQTQWTWDEAGIETGDQNDFTIRRGRLKATYANKYGEAVMQVDVTEEGVDIKDAYLRAKAPSIDWLSLRAGVFDRPFGYEISYSSSNRESPERSRIFQTLFPKERDLGVEIAFKGPKETFLKDFTLNAGIFAGNGGQSEETDSGKDFIGHLAYKKTINDISFGLGTSLYYGGVRLAGEDTQKAYKLVNEEFVQDKDLEPGDYADRYYYGLDGQFTFKSVVGTTNLRAEYLWGTQPGASGESKSPTGAITGDIYSRDFNGYYIQLAQDIGKSKHTLVAKYDAYDPNTKLSKNECLTAGDVSYNTFGFGWLYRANKNIRLMAFYEITSNEKVRNDIISTDFSEDISDNKFTLRLQYKF